MKKKQTEDERIKEIALNQLIQCLQKTLDFFHYKNYNLTYQQYNKLVELDDAFNFYIKHNN